MNCVGIQKDMYVFLIQYYEKAKTKSESEIELIKIK